MTRAAVSSAGRSYSATSPPTAKRIGEQQEFGNAGLVIAHDLFDAWQQFQNDGQRAALQTRITPPQSKLRTLLEHAARTSTKTKHHRQFARNLLKRWPALSTFTHTDHVEPTNNHAERGLRGAVTDRKLSPGTHSERDERSIERLNSASTTCRPRNQSPFAYLTETTTAPRPPRPNTRPQPTTQTG